MFINILKVIILMIKRNERKMLKQKQKKAKQKQINQTVMVKQNQKKVKRKQMVTVKKNRN